VETHEVAHGRRDEFSAARHLHVGIGVCYDGIAVAVGNAQTGITYLVTDTYSIKEDVLSTTALTMAAGGSCVVQGTTLSGSNLPTMTNTSSTVTGGTYNTYGAAVKVITAAANAGIGSFVCTPKATISADSNTTLASSYTATAQYSIVTGP